MGNISISQHKNVIYLGCILDDDLSGESMALRVNSKLRRMLYNAPWSTNITGEETFLKVQPK